MTFMRELAKSLVGILCLFQLACAHAQSLAVAIPGVTANQVTAKSNFDHSCACRTGRRPESIEIAVSGIARTLGRAHSRRTPARPRAPQRRVNDGTEAHQANHPRRRA